MKNLIAGIVAVLLLGFTSQVARAQNYYWKESNGVVATFVYRYAVTLPACTLHTFKTQNLAAGVDTIMWIVDTATNDEVSWNDDFGGAKSQITYFTSCTDPAQAVTVWVRAKDNMWGGLGGPANSYEFLHNTTSLGYHRIGGYTLRTGNVTAATDTMETVFVNNGAGGTRLIRFFKAADGHYQWSGSNAQSGIGFQSKLSGLSATDELWIVATPSESTREGPVRVVRNDQASGDTDSDTLGNNLEAEACTCRDVGIFTCSTGPSYTCTSSASSTPRDTDSDGLWDAAELLGIDPAQGPTISLPWWGANPRHRDLFVEMDRVDLVPNPPSGPDQPGVFTLESTAIDAARPFSELPITNPDGSPGIATHFDIGVGEDGLGCIDEDGDGDIFDGDVDSITRFCGNMGGGGTVMNTQPVAGSSAGCAQDLTNMMSGGRIGVFHWMVRWGQYGGNTPARVCSYIGNGSRPFDLVAHELGHQLGLQHNWDEQNKNYAPTYQSLMNYSYGTDYYVNGSPLPVRRPQFSVGTLSAFPLNPSSLSETTNFGSTQALDFLTYAESPYDFDVDASSPRHVDWNRDGVFNSSVRAHIMGEPNKRGAGGDDMPTAIGEQNLPAFQTDAAVGATYSSQTAYTYVIANGQSDGKFWFTRRTTGNWSSWASLTGFMPTFALESSPAVASLSVAGEDTLFVFGADLAGTVHFARFDAWTMTLEAAWQTLPLPPGISFREVNTTVVGGRLYVVGADTALWTTTPEGQVWLGWFDGTTWNGFQRVETALGPVVSISDTDPSNPAAVVVTPGIASGPDGRLYMQTRIPVSTADPGDDGLAMFQRDPTTLQWSENVGPLLGETDVDCFGPRGRISMVYRPHLTASGSALPSGNGALWTWYSTLCDGNKNETFYRWTWGMLSATSQPFNRGKWHRADLGNGSCDRVWRFGVGLGVGVVEHPSGIQTFVAHNPDSAHGCTGGVWWVPNAQGLATPVELPSDWDDSTKIRANLCTSLHDLDSPCTYCTGNGISCAAPPAFTPQSCYDDEEFVD